MKINIRNAVQEDCARIRPLQKEIADLHHEGRPDLFKTEARCNHSTYIDFDCFYLDDICVLKAFRKNGIGRMLFNCCKTLAGEKRCKMVELGVWAFNTEALAFYKSCGMTDRIRRMEYRLED